MADIAIFAFKLNNPANAFLPIHIRAFTPILTILFVIHLILGTIFRAKNRAKVIKF